MEEKTEPSLEQVQAYSRLLVANRSRIYGFILSLVHDRTAANDILQDASAILWEKFSEFERGTNFAAWAMTVSRHSVMNWRRRQKKLPVRLSDEQFESLCDVTVSLNCEFDERRHALENCMRELSPENRQVLTFRYMENLPVSSIAHLIGCSRVAVYKRMNRIHALLLDCINTRLDASK